MHTIVFLTACFSIQFYSSGAQILHIIRHSCNLMQTRIDISKFQLKLHTIKLNHLISCQAILWYRKCEWKKILTVCWICIWTITTQIQDSYLISQDMSCMVFGQFACERSCVSLGNEMGSFYFTGVITIWKMKAPLLIICLFSQ